MNSMEDYLVRGTAAEGRIRAFAVRSTEMIRTMQEIHQTSPNVTAGLGRLMTGAAMMGAMMKDENARLTLSIRGDGPVQGMTVTADSHGFVKGFANVKRVPLTLLGPGKLDVGGPIGYGTLTVIREDGIGEPYSSRVNLLTGEIGDDLTYYFATSEQTPSAVGLGVLVDTDETVKDAGGFIIQLMPDVLEEEITALEEALKNAAPISEMIDQGMTPEDILTKIIGNMGFELLEKQPIAWKCDCSEERVAHAIMSISKSDIQEMIDDEKPAEVKCHFCEKNYVFTTEKLKEMLASSAK